MYFLQALIDTGALVNISDDEGNSPLHVKCFGETNKPSEIDCIEMLIKDRARLVARNHRVCLQLDLFIYEYLNVGCSLVILLVNQVRHAYHYSFTRESWHNYTNEIWNYCVSKL